MSDKEFNAVLLRMGIASLGKEYITYLEGEIDKLEFRQDELAKTETIQEYETDMAVDGESNLSCTDVVREYVSLFERIESIKRSLDIAKLIIAADSRRKGLSRKNNSLH